ncbi:MAG TPA: 3,4-dihydroxy-2-butanone-4-phosphate synthase [Saprospiraceae bacterium]|nr:3,4-dihydroxy-2-butanone-4-phosphate synthase [Saprospiraceae bacterium]MCB9328796.1 3,4-dihydroxy-2-butanone-4-phosphate synthase [Lewinellaceae bacterium]HPK09929.1 3,4-dihydroxy-2-butanone-4-phosphate synthase [Saprospiraceae bacterium]HPQ20352.1 3,4-dihydroxy-2-butanone-4-phosphate synthase [Saprospiraceae bacterium]HRX28857.1 3,4-dihydroxy-2-butanone-4-phosphate synthase [Saprospiraceae bacterium]
MDSNTKLEIQLDSVEEAIEDIKNGKVIIVVDDEDRENEGDFVCAAEKVTPEIINFMSKFGRGLICTPIQSKRGTELGLQMMVNKNTDSLETAFTVSIDYLKSGCTTGISAYDRATGIKAMTQAGTKPEDFSRPGHIFPLIAKTGGVLKRTGHTEAAVDLAELAGLFPAGVLVEILNEDGTMARLPQLKVIAEHFDMKLISIQDLVAYRMKSERLIFKKTEFALPGQEGFTLVAFEEKNEGLIHIALKYGEWSQDDPVLVRVHSSSNASDVLYTVSGSTKFDFREILNRIRREGKGVLLLMRKSDREQNMLEAITDLQSKIQNKYVPKDRKNIVNNAQKELGIGAQILYDLGVRKMKLLTRNPSRKIGVLGYGLEIVENVKE